MVALLTLDVAKQHLRVDHTDDDADITRKIEQASAIALTFMKRTIGTPDPEDPSIVDWTPETLPADIASGVERILSQLYDDRAGGTAVQTPGAYLPVEAMAMLLPYRTPSLA